MLVYACDTTDVGKATQLPPTYTYMDLCSGRFDASNVA